MTSIPNARLPGQDFLRTLRTHALQALGTSDTELQAVLETDLDDHTACSQAARFRPTTASSKPQAFQRSSDLK